jgi:hypothetical protein
MPLNIPLLPIQIDVGFHPSVRFRPLRPFRFSIRVLMLVVGIMAIFCSFWVWFQNYRLRLARTINFHANQAFDPFLPGVVDRPWHAKMYPEHHAALLRNAMIVTPLLQTLLSFVLIFLIGRAINCFCRRSHPPHRVRSWRQHNAAFHRFPQSRLVWPPSG